MKVEQYGFLPSDEFFKDKNEVYVIQDCLRTMDKVIVTTTNNPDAFCMKKAVFKVKKTDKPLHERMLNRILAAFIPLMILTSCNHTMLVQQKGEVNAGKIKGVGPVEPFNPNASFFIVKKVRVK